MAAYVRCPGSYLCDKVPSISNISRCVTMDLVCDGKEDCDAGDDETLCGEILSSITNIKSS